MKRFAFHGILVLTLFFLLNGCASTEEATTQTSTTTVPGEKVSGSDAVSPNVGPSGAGANVHF